MIESLKHRGCYVLTYFLFCSSLLIGQYIFKNYFPIDIAVGAKKLIEDFVVIATSIMWISFLTTVMLRLHSKNIAIINELKKTINSLEEKHKAIDSKLNLLKIALDNLDVAVWIRDKNLNIIYFNKYYSEIVFNNNASANSVNFELDQIAKNNAALVLNSEIIKVDERYIIKDGRRYFYQFIDKFIPKLNFVISLGFDITSKDKVNRELQLNIQAQAELLESSSNACVIFESNRRIKFFNHAFARLWELEEKFLESSPTYEMVLDKLHHLRKLPEQANYQKFRREQIDLFTNLTGPYNDFFYLPDGRSLRVLVIPQSLGDLLFSFEDMTDRIALESSYNTLAKVQHATINNLHEGICVFGENGRVALYNPKFASMWELNEEFLNTKPLLSDLIEQYHFLFSGKEEFEHHKQEMMYAFSKRQKKILCLEYHNKRFINRLIIALPGGGTLISDHDITSSVVAEMALIERNKALEEADRIKSEFLANMAYELRSPLTSIIGYAEMIKRKYVGSLNPVQEDYVSYIVVSAEKLTTLIDDVMDLTMVEAGKIELHLTSFNVINSLKHTIALLATQIKFLKLNYVLKYDHNELFFITADEARFRQIIFKLLCNAIEYSHTGNEIIITIDKDEKFCIISISDQGKGIAANEQEYIFNKFYQATNTKTSERSGTGLGLSIVKTFVELHGGMIEFTSQEESGSTFTCKFPINLATNDAGGDMS